MNIFSKLEQLINLTESEKILVDFIKKYPMEFSEMRVNEICQYCFISKSTIYRLCKKLEVDGISELKLIVATDFKDYQKEEINYDFPFGANQPEHEIINNLETLYKYTIKNTKNLFDPENIRNVAKALKNAKQIDIYASAGNVFFAENFKFQMEEIGKTVTAPVDEYVQRLMAARGDKNHIAMIISFDGRSRFLDIILKILKKNQTPIVLITSTMSKKLQEYADYVVYMSSYENHYNKISSFSTRLTLLYILDVLYANYFGLDYDENYTYKISTFHKMNRRRPTLE